VGGFLFLPQSKKMCCNSQQVKIIDISVELMNGNEIKLSTFPASKYDALTILYLQNQNLSGMTPKEIVSMFDTAYKKFVDADRVLNGKPPFYEVKE